MRMRRKKRVAVSDYRVVQAQAIWKDIVGRLQATGGRPQIDTTVPFENVKEGFTRLAEGPMGKVLVRVLK